MSIERRIARPNERVDTSTETACLSGLTCGILPVQPVVRQDDQGAGQIRHGALGALEGEA